MINIEIYWTIVLALMVGIPLGLSMNQLILEILDWFWSLFEKEDSKESDTGDENE